jgi:drug/metabolite transporter (DMT)-like permease
VTTAAAMTSERRETRPLFAISLRLTAMAGLTLMFALTKLLSEWGVNLVELVFYRQLFALPTVYAWICATRGPMGFTTRHIGGHATRSAVGLTSMLFNFGAVALLPLAESTTIGFTGPIFATILSALVLREATGIHRWGAVLLGFVGVVIMARPDAGHFPPLGLAVGIVAAFGTATVSILLRRLSRTEDSAVIVFWFSLLSLPPAGLMLIWYGQMHDPAIFAVIAAMGAIGGITQLLLTGALRWGPVAIVLPMDYSAILWATLLGWLIWGALPIASTWAGAALIIVSGLYIAAREHRLGREETLRAKADADIRA